MTTYVITSPYFCAGIVASGGAIVQAAPILKWAIGKQMGYFLSYAKAKGWTVEPIIESTHPHVIEHQGTLYTFEWNDDVITEITVHPPDDSAYNIVFRDLPQAIKNLL